MRVEFGEDLAAHWGLRRWFEEDGVACEQSGNDHVTLAEIWVVPRDDGEYGSDRYTFDVTDVIIGISILSRLVHQLAKLEYIA